MEITYKNLDKDYRKVRREFTGEIQPKYWYRTFRGEPKSALIKRQHSQTTGKNKPKSKTYNHIGEYVAYLLAKKAQIPVCPVELVTLHDNKNRYSDKIMLFRGCASYNIKKPSSELVPGEVIVRNFYRNNNSPNSYMAEYMEDSFDIILQSIIAETINMENKMGKRTKEEIDADAKENVRRLIDMVVYDCLFGNNDRHSENWAMEIDRETGKVELYSMFDNEAVLGFRRPLDEIRNIVQNSSNLENDIDITLFSRMGFGEHMSKVPYKRMLKFLVKKYPEYAIPSINNMLSRVDEDYVNEIYDSLEGISTRGDDSDELTEDDELPGFYRIFGTQLYRYRRNFALTLVRSQMISNENNEENCLMI